MEPIIVNDVDKNQSSSSPSSSIVQQPSSSSSSTRPVNDDDPIISINNNVPMFEEINSLLALSAFVYIFAECRQMALLGLMPLSFEGFMLESDRMGIMDILNGTPHRFPAYSDDGGMHRVQLFSIILKFVMEDYEEDKLSEREKAAAEGSEAFGFMNRLYKKSLKDYKPPKKGDPLEKNVYYIRQFIDNLQKEALSNDVSCLAFLTAIMQNDVATQVDLIPSVAKKVFKPGSPLYNYSLAQNNDQRIVWMNDMMGHKECVYTIAVSHSKRRAIVTFRGTATWTDILANADFDIFSKDNPIKDHYAGKTNEIHTNNGYSQFLCIPRKDTGRSKYDEIADRVDEYGKELGDKYSLYVTGHSMGGALAAIFGFHASTESRFAQVGNPVRVYTFNAAIPGRINFAKAFQHQERSGLLQHARVTNKGDIVSLLHPQIERTFAHTGLSISLKRKKQPSISYVEDLDWWKTRQANIQTNVFLNFPWRKLGKIRTYHSTDTIAQRLKGTTKDPSTLNDYYNRFVNPKMKKRSSDDDFQMRIKYNGNDDNNKSRSSGRNWPYFPHDKNNNSDVEANLPLTLEYAIHQAYLAKLRQKHQQQLETLELEQDYGDGEPDPGMADLLPKINSSLSHDRPKSDLSDVSDIFLHQRQDGIDRLLHEPTARGKFVINSIPMTSAVAAANSSTEANNQSPSSSLRYSLSNDKTCREEERREIIRRMSSHNLKTPSAHNGPMPNVRTLQLDIPTAAATVSLQQQSQKQLQLLGSNGGKRKPAHLRLSNSAANGINDHSTDIVVRDEPFKIFILLLQPRAKIFELIQVIYSPTLTTVGDIIDMIPTNASEPALGNQQYIGLCRPCNSNEDDQQTITDFSSIASSSSFYNNPTNRDRYGSVLRRCAKIESGEIFIALLPHYSPKQMISYGTPILQTDQVMRLMDRSDPLKLIQLSSHESKIGLSSSLSVTAYDKDNDNKYQEYGPTKMITTNNRLVETPEKGKTIIRNIPNDKKTDHGNTKIIRGTAIEEKIKVCESSDSEEEYDA